MKIILHFLLIGLTSLLLTAEVTGAGDTATDTATDLSPGAKKAAACATCHGQDGIAVLDLAPNLAGQKALYTTIQMKNYRSGKRQHEVMSIIAKPLSDEDIELLAEYYEQLDTDKTGSTDNDKCEPEENSS